MKLLRALPVVVLAALASGIVVAAPSAALLDSAPSVAADRKGNGAAILLLKFEGLGSAEMADKTLPGVIRDLGSDAKAVVEIARVEEVLPASAGTRVWRLSLAVKDLPASVETKRWLVVPLGAKKEWLSYTFGPPVAPKFGWTVGTVANIAISPGQPIPVSIAASGARATRVRVTMSALAEKTNRQLLAPHGFLVCRESAKPCTQPIDIEMGESAQLWLHGAQRPGQFEGSVTLASDANPQGESISMNVWVTSLRHQLAGIGVILAGVCLNLLVTVLVRNRISRNQLLRPSALLNSSLDELATITQKAKLPPDASLKPVMNKIEEQRGALSLSVLETQGLPALTMSPWSANADTVENYRRHLQEVSNWVGVLELILRDGVGGIAERWSHPSHAAKARELSSALADVLAPLNVTAAPALDAVRKAVSDALEKYDRTVFKNELALERPDGQRTRNQVKSPEELRVETAILSHVGWLFLLVTTTLAGAYVLVFSERAAGFGTPLDYLLCLIWGIGLPAAGQLTQATTGTVASNFGIVKV